MQNQSTDAPQGESSPLSTAAPHVLHRRLERAQAVAALAPDRQPLILIILSARQADAAPADDEDEQADRPPPVIPELKHQSSFQTGQAAGSARAGWLLMQ